MNDDIAAVREFRADLDEPREGALTRGRWQLARPEPPRRRRSWVLATAGAAVAVAVVVGGAATVSRHDRPGAQPEQRATPSTQQRTDAADLPVTQGTKAPMNPSVTGQAGGTHAQAVEALTRLAAKQTDGPLVIGPDQVLYVKSYSLTDGDTRYIHEVWMDVRSGATLRIRRNDGSPRPIDRLSSQREIDEYTASSKREPAGLTNPNAAYVAAFPTDAGQAHAIAASWLDWSQRQHPGRDAGAMIFERLHQVLHFADPLLTAAQRRTLYLAIGELPSVRATTATIAGRQYDVICAPSQAEGTRCVLFDPATGRYVGDSYALLDLVVKLGKFNFVDVGVQPRPAVGPERGTPAPEPGDATTTPKR
ncbi:hypothetical protein ACFPIJ_54650 [Dactylosporangium cerinum]|uniref:CU044_5270 family protein n=1 Tax=Dactylosporangium cerinum TaxID=1434730 RepID=A0ABV9WFJ0_9ACTN